MAKLPSRRDETLGGYIVHGVPFPVSTDEEGARVPQEDGADPDRAGIQDHLPAFLRAGQPWFAGLSNKHLLASRDPKTGYMYANPRGHDMYSGAETKWVDITDLPAQVHAFTVCYFGSEEFLPETPYVLALVEFEGVNTLLLTRLMGVDPEAPSLNWIGMQVKPHFLRNSKLKPTDVYFGPG